MTTSVASFSAALWWILRAELWTGRERGSIALLLLVSALRLGFAFRNHRPDPPAAARIWWRMLCLTTVIAVRLLAGF